MDCVEGLKTLPDECANVIICDPPYNVGKNFGNNRMELDMNDYLKFCKEWITQCLRILKNDGTLYIYGFSENLAYVRTILDCHVRWLVWHYTNKTTPNLNFWQRSHESILACSKVSRPQFNRDDVREPYTESFVKNSAGKTRANTKGRYGTKETKYRAHENGALPRDVIKVQTLAGGKGSKERVDHPTQKPLELCEKLLRASINKDEENLLVVPFVGSGSELVVAKYMNVRYIGFEINDEYIELCNERLSAI
ncbi:DNA methylase [Heterosigma akashiwo virus 01]|uniref:DNA methylase n=1 Tax=Heterosigma akashiwo virus 01 TaxID=97195 RepID=A0A1C9C5F8_HAV01|nr:DNA methyltransferase [Heterosigma akashiwo virus 01]AOM63518.1 DNA methylase [Heterosigma akashiwo virus 01]